MVDNTFLTPYFQRPLELGADITLHSTTKFMEGHNVSVGGSITAANQEHLDKIIDIDQSPIGRTPRSNPATYTQLFTPNDSPVKFAR